MMLEDNAIYLGDGLYAEDGGHGEFRVFAYNGFNVTNRVFLNTNMIKKLAELAGWKVSKQ